MVNIWSFIAQVIGERCALCRATATGLCDGCRHDLTENGGGCPICAVPLPSSARHDLACARCQQRRPDFTSTVAALRYQPPVDRLIAGLKYRQQLELARPLAHCLVDAVRQQRDRNGTWPQQLIPVPMPPDRLRQRGLNQACEIARIVGRELGIPVARGVVARPHDIATQRGLSRAARRRNVRGAFIARRAAASHVAIVDDVMTTGATADALSRTLRAAGASTVEVWVVARTTEPSGDVR